MKNLVLIFSIPLAFVGIILAVYTAFSLLENPRSEFVTFEEMKSAGMIDAGWLPAYFPTSAINIREGHNIDTNRVWASFNFKKSDMKLIEKVCLKIVENNGGSKFLCPPYHSRTSTFVFHNTGMAFYNSYPDPTNLP